MSSEVALKVDNIGKRYEIYEAPHYRLFQTLLRGRKQFYKEFWALKDISFEVKKGECLGIIGRNGCGKSTLLQIIAGTLAPTTGSVAVNGKVAALLELGSGFNPEFTGRENVYMNGAIMGLSKTEMDKTFDKIATFADIGQFIDQPVKIYSSGMYVRLAFAAAINVDPDILIIDEALAVGDIHFQAKCMTALTRIKEKGVTILFVSHDVGAVKSLCVRAIYLDCGAVKAVGAAADVAEQYVRVVHEEMNQEYANVTESLPLPSNLINAPPPLPEITKETQFKRSGDFDKKVASFRYGTGRAKITYVELLNKENQPITLVDFNQTVKVRIYFEVLSEVDISVFFAVLDHKKTYLTGCGFRQVGYPLLEGKPGNLYLAEYILRLPLQEGNYSILAQLSSPRIPDVTAEFLDVINDAVVFSVNKWDRARIWSQIFLFPTLELRRLNSDAESH